jgi:hypothetical protein
MSFFRTFRKLRKNDVLFEVRKFENIRSDSETEPKVRLKVRNAGPYIKSKSFTYNFPHDVLLKIKQKIDQTAQENGFISYVSKVTDLFQISLSYAYQPNNKTIALLLLVPQEYLLNLNQYLPFPLTQNLSPNHSLMPSVGQNDILAYNGFDTFKIILQSDLASCHKMGETYFCKRRNDLRTDVTETCLGSLYLQQEY